MYTDTQTIVKEAEGAQMPGRETPKRILVVDDEAVVTEVLERYLRKDGFDVAVAADGAEALRIAEKWAPDLIVLDLMLPIVDGLEVCRRIRQTGRTPIIMVTAKG